LFGGLAAFGTDQEFMQRLLALDSREKGQKAMLWSIPCSLGVLFLYLAVGTGLFVFYSQNPGLVPPKAEPDKVYVYFISQIMPMLLRGLVLSAVFMASIHSPLLSLSSSFVADFYRPLARPAEQDWHYLIVAKFCVVFFGLALGGIAYAFGSFHRGLWLALKIGGVTYGPLLGVFLLGLLTKRRADFANVAAMIGMAGVDFALLVLSERGIVPVDWNWLVILGTLGTAGISWVLGPVLDLDRQVSKNSSGGC